MRRQGNLDTKSLVVLLKVIRPHIVAGGFLGYLLGALLALNYGAEFNATLFILGYIVVLLGDLSTHYTNNYHDTEIDANTPGKTFGNTNILVTYPEAKTSALKFAVLLSIASTLTSAFLVIQYDLPLFLLLLVVSTNILGWLYSSPPVQLNANYLGETTIALGTGFVVPAVGFICLYGKFTASFITFIAPMVLYGYILSLSLELPDLETDRSYGRKNLVVLFNRRPTALLILLLSVAAFAYFTIGVTYDFKTPLILPAIALASTFASLHGLMKRSLSHDDVNQMSVINISALFLFLICLNGYLLYQLF